MLATSHCLRTRSPIKELKKLENGSIAIATLMHGVRIFAYDTCESISTSSHENLNSDTTAVAFSPNGEFIAFAHQSHIFILHLPSNIVLKKINTEKEIIQKLQFDPESKYIIAATHNGRVLQYRYDGSSLIGRLYSFKEQKQKKKTTAICDFAFYASLMAGSGYDGVIYTIDLHSRTNKTSIQNDTARVTSLCFMDSERLLSSDLKGSLYLNSVKTGKCLQKADSCFTKIRQILLMPNPNYLLVVGDTKDVAVYDANTLKLLHKAYIEFEDIVTSLEIVDEHTIIATLKHSSLEKVHISTTDKLKSFIMQGELDEAYRLVQKDPLLLGTKEYKVLEISYNKIYQKARSELINGNKDTAQKLLSTFKYTDVKRQEIDMLFKAFENYTRFKSLYIEKKYALAYAMASKFPPLQETFQYQKMEELWDDILKSALRQMEHGHLDNATTLFKEFATIMEKRPTIKLVLNHTNEYLKFFEALEKRDYKMIHDLAHSTPLLTLLPEYKGIESSIEKELLHIKRYIDKCDLNSAISKLSKLQNIDSIKEDINEHKHDLRSLKKLQDSYSANNFVECFETIDANPALLTTELGELLQKHWSKLISNCEQSALKGNIKSIKEKLGELISLQSRRDKIGDLFRLAFHTKIKSFIAHKEFRKAEAIIYSYIDIFGLDTEIKDIMKRFERGSKSKLALTHESTSRDRDSWMEHEAIMGA